MSGHREQGELVGEADPSCDVALRAAKERSDW